METFFIQYILISFVHSPPKLSQVLPTSPPIQPHTPPLSLFLRTTKTKQNQEAHSVSPEYKNRKQNVQEKDQ